MKFTFAKQALIQAALFVCILLIASCDNNQNTEDTKEVAEDQNDERFDDNNLEDDAQFLVNSAETNLEEIHLGQLAQQKGSATHIKELGKMMEDAHTKSQRELTALAQSKGISIPNSPTEDVRDAYNNLNEKTGDDFDQEYANRMVRGHQDAIDAFEKAATGGSDPDIKNWARATLPDIRKHYDHSLESQKKLGNMSLENN